MEDADLIIKKFDKLINLFEQPNGLKISGQGILADNTKKFVELLDKIQRFIFFMEARQTKMLRLMGKIAGLSEEEINNLEKPKV